jgi:hypothetical protein
VNGLASTTLRGVTCPTCKGVGRRYRSDIPWADGATCDDCFGDGFIRADRSMTRQRYDQNREAAHGEEIAANLLDAYARQHGGRDGSREREHAAVIRAELSAPTDPKEAARNARWHKLTAALILARRATTLRQQARELARAA